MIKKIENFSRKSFKSYSGPENEFNKKNILFGYNGRGKSSLAIGVINEYTKEQSMENTRIYNEKYVEDNLIMKDDSEKIKGVVANFGEKAVEIEKSIEKKENEIIDTDSTEEEIDRLTEVTRNQIDNIHDKRKGNARISKKNSSYDLETVLERYKADYESAIMLNVTREDLEKTHGDDSLEKKLGELRKVDIEKINDFIRIDDWKEVSDTCTSTFERIEIPSQEIITWLNEGIHIHEKESSCQFCESPIDYLTIKNKVDNYNSNELQKAINFIHSYKKDLNDYIVGINNFLNKKDYVLTILTDPEVEKNYKNIENLNEDLISIVGFLDDKISEMNESVNLEKDKKIDLAQILKQIKCNYEDIKNTLNNKQDDLRSLINNQDQLVKGAIALEIEKDLVIKENLVRIVEERKKLAEIIEGNKELKKQIEELSSSKSTVVDFANLLTQVLTNLGIDIEIILDESKNNYILQHSKSEELLTVDDISEGEKSLLSLLFFYYELFEDKEQVKFKDNIDLVVIDDPISSLDGANRYYVLEIIKTLLTQDKAQIFVLTHVWDDFSDLCYGKGNDDSYSFFEVYKNSDGESVIRVKKPHTNPYQMLFQEVYQFSEKKRSEELKHCEVYHLPNSMRKVFEEFLSFKSSKSIIPTQSSQAHIQNIMSITSNTKKHKLAKLLSICNVLSHKASYNPEETLESAKFLMSIIRDEDEKHYYAMRGSN